MADLLSSLYNSGKLNRFMILDNIDLTARLVFPAEILFRELDGETVLLQTRTGRYYGLDEVGTRMWSLLRQHGGIHGAYLDLLSEYEVGPERLQEDLLRFVGALQQHDLLRLQDRRP